MRWKKLLRAIEKGDLDPLFCEVREQTPVFRITSGNYLRQVLSPKIREAQKFRLDDPEVEGLSRREGWESGRAMHAAGLFHLPFKECFVETTLDIGRPQRANLLSLLNEVGEGHVEIQVFLNNPGSDGKHHFWWMPGKLNLSYHGGSGWRVWDGYKMSSKGTAIEGARELGNAAVMEAILFTVLVNTSWAHQEHVHTRGTKLLSRPAPEDGFTVVRARAPAGGEGRGPVGERKRVRLHWRAGHNKRQHYGRANRLIKQIYIEPVLVGYREEGVITQEREVSLPAGVAHI